MPPKKMKPTIADKKTNAKLRTLEKKASALQRFDRASAAVSKAMRAAMDAGFQGGFLVQRSIDLASDLKIKKAVRK